jgi:multiple sugar transport system substrate-binding protein
MKRFTSLFPMLLYLAALLLMSGCQRDFASWQLPWRTQERVDETTTPPAMQTDDRTLVTVLAPAGDETEQASFQTLIDQFQQANPAVAITVTLAPDYDTTLTLALAANPPPDLVVLDGPRASELARLGALTPLPTISSIEDIHPLLRNLFSLEEELFCAPREVRTLALVYNRSLFDGAGLAYPSTGWTWDDLRTAAEALTNPDTATVGMALPPDFSRWLPFLYQAGGSVTDEAMTVMTINSDEASAAMTFFVMLVIDGFAAAPADLESTWGGEALARGRAAMAIEGNWVAPFLKRNYPDLDFGVAELPVGPQGRATPAFATCFAIPVDAQNRQAAERLVDYLMNPATLLSLTETGYAMPPRLSLHERWLQMNPEQQPFLNSLAYAQPWRFGARFMPLFSTVNSGLQQAFLSVRSVADILAEADGVGNRALAQ